MRYHLTPNSSRSQVAKQSDKQTSTAISTHAPSPRRPPLIMGNSSGDICYLSRQSIKRRRRSDGELGTACGNRPIFRVNKHKSSTRQVIPSPVSLSIDHPRVPRNVTLRWWHARTHARNNGDNYVFRGYKRGGTRGTSHQSVEARAAAIRHPTERSSLEWPHCTRDDPGSRAEISIVSAPRKSDTDIRIKRSGS